MPQDRSQRKRLWRKWETYPRAHLNEAIRQLGIAPDRLRVLGIHEWQWIEKRVKRELYRRPYHTRQRFPFMQITIDAWIYDPVSIRDFRTLVPPQTKVFAALGDENRKLWWCQGDFETVASVFEATRPSLEILVVSPKFNWLLTVNHHDEFFSVGEPVSSRVKQLAASLKNSA